jgi:hypothetical protein
MSPRKGAGGAACAANDALELAPECAAVPLASLPPLPDDGAAVLKAAKLVCRGDDQFCLIRKIGSDWLVAETYAAVAPGDPVLIILGEDVCVAGKTSWVGEARVYVSFAREVDIEALLASSRLVRDGRQPRMPRVKVDAWARLRVGARMFSVRLRDISQGGAKIQVHGLLSAGQQAVLTVRDLPPIAGMIRWCGESEGGVSFNQPLGFAELAAWLAAHREPRAAADQRSVPGSAASRLDCVPALHCVQSA